MKFGVKLIITHWQAWELSRAFAIGETCFKTSHFCVVLPKKCQLPQVEIVKTVTKAWLLKNKADSMKFGNVSRTRINLPIYPIFMKNLVTGTTQNEYTNCAEMKMYQPTINCRIFE